MVVGLEANLVDALLILPKLVYSVLPVLDTLDHVFALLIHLSVLSACKLGMIYY